MELNKDCCWTSNYQFFLSLTKSCGTLGENKTKK